ncbi:MAG: UDP-N-acetylmuramoyl-L-alanine--D-glutamate ligase [Deltaproteobacteria bacterium]|nr:UDP-N-acetylmuramoyl-L-alanine--D-glutamate ligase [Deltaproteobacteria bacterium]
MSRAIDTVKTIATPVGVLGVGVEGRATIDFLLAQGIADVTALDANPVDGLPGGVATVFGPGHDHDLGRFATVFRSPGIRPDHPGLAAARAKGTRVTSATSLFLERCEAKVIGVTGTLGKGTATSLCAAMLEAAGLPTLLGGNIGLSPLSFLERATPGHLVVLELSSFQCMDLTRSPEVAVVLKTTSEHLDWHKDVDEYLAAKAHLLAGQAGDDRVVFHADSPGSASIAASGRGRRLAYSLEREVEEGVFLAEGRLVLRMDGRDQVLPLDPGAMRLPGRFNLENVAAALLTAHLVGVDPETACGAAAAFEGLPHRLELCAEGHGIRFYNDSYATRPDATLAALACFDGPLSLILGGSEKHADFGPLARAVAKHPGLVHVSLIGDTAARLFDDISRAGPPDFPVMRCPDLATAAQAAATALDRGGVVLLSPACASFGLFPNYKVRGERFRALAQALARG